MNLVGEKVQVTLTNGGSYTGVFHTATPFAAIPAEYRCKYVLKAVTVVQEPKEKSTTTIAAGETMVVDMSQVVAVHVKSIRLGNGSNTTANGNGQAFTDTEISGATGGTAKSWVAAGSAWTTPSGGKSNPKSRADGLIGSARGPLQGSIGAWDQFKANEELFNVKGEFDESLYTTQLDKSNMDQERIQQAEQIAREIESSTTTNMHLAEERGHKVEGDYDEEDRYSGVLKKEQPKPKAAAMNYAAALGKKEEAVTPQKTPEKAARPVTPEKTEETQPKEPEVAKEEPAKTEEITQI